MSRGLSRSARTAAMTTYGAAYSNIDGHRRGKRRGVTRDYDRSESDDEYVTSDTWRDFKLGSFYDVQDHKGRWYEAEVVDVSCSPLRPDVVEEVKFHFLFWEDEHDEWYPRNSPMIEPHMSRIYLPGTELLKGHRVDVLDVNFKESKWLPATVVECSQRSVKVRYAGFSSEHDEHVERGSERIMPYGHKSKAKSKDFQKVVDFHYNPDSQKRSVAALTPEQYEQFTTHLAGMEGHLSIHKSDGDGNCLFRSISHQLYGTEDFHAVIRSKCVDYMEFMRDFYQNFINDRDADEYFAIMRVDGTWGGEPEIQALMELYERPIQIYVYDREKIVNILARADCAESSSMVPIRLNYVGGNHYNSIVSDDHPASLLEPSQAGLEESRRLASIMGDDRETAGLRGLGEEARLGEHAGTALGRRISMFRQNVKFSGIEVELNWVGPDSEMFSAVPNDDADEERQLQMALKASAIDSPQSSPSAKLDSQDLYDEDEALRLAIEASQTEMSEMNEEEQLYQQAIEESKRIAEIERVSSSSKK